MRIIFGIRELIRDVRNWIGTWKRHGAPASYHQFSCWANWYMAAAQKRPPRNLMLYFKPNARGRDKHVQYHEDEIVPMIQTDGGTAWYRITKKHHRSYSADLLPSDDGVTYDMVFSHLTPGKYEEA